MSTLDFTAVTSSGRAYDIAFPLHPMTRSAQGVSDLLTAVLEAISRTAEAGRDISDGDVLQAVVMALAIRGRMIDARTDSVQSLVEQLFADAFAAAGEAQPYVAGRS
jgi:protein-disulfide isomerase-like protein with CxxC motif